ncbi:MAG: hypothetical protein ACK4NC_03090 [Candidatus Gracilibacteria bacterium]
MKKKPLKTAQNKQDNPSILVIPPMGRRTHIIEIEAVFDDEIPEDKREEDDEFILRVILKDTRAPQG